MRTGFAMSSSNRTKEEFGAAMFRRLSQYSEQVRAWFVVGGGDGGCTVGKFCSVPTTFASLDSLC